MCGAEQATDYFDDLRAPGDQGRAAVMGQAQNPPPPSGGVEPAKAAEASPPPPNGGAPAPPLPAANLAACALCGLIIDPGAFAVDRCTCA